MTKKSTNMDEAYDHQIIDNLVDEISDVGNRVMKDLLNNPDLMARYVKTDDLYELSLKMMSLKDVRRHPI